VGAGKKDQSGVVKSPIPGLKKVNHKGESGLGISSQQTGVRWGEKGGNTKLCLRNTEEKTKPENVGCLLALFPSYTSTAGEGKPCSRAKKKF